MNRLIDPRRSRGLLAVSLVLVSALGSSGSAEATGGYGYDGSGAYWYPDNANLSYCIQPSIPADSHYRVHDGMQYVDSSTSMYDTYSATCWNDTDAWLQYSSAQGNWGLATCQYTPGYGVCDRWIVEINESAILVWSHPGKEDFNITHIVRHEIGHTTGQRHPAGVSAMVSEINQTPNSAYYLYLSHERTCHINRFVTGQATC